MRRCAARTGARRSRVTRHPGGIPMLWKPASLLCLAVAVGGATSSARAQDADPATTVAAAPTRTPIKHLVVIFDENRPFDHYFGTYPLARNLPGESPFVPRLNT